MPKCSYLLLVFLFLLHSPALPGQNMPGELPNGAARKAAFDRAIAHLEAGELDAALASADSARVNGNGELYRDTLSGLSLLIIGNIYQAEENYLTAATYFDSSAQVFIEAYGRPDLRAGVAYYNAAFCLNSGGETYRGMDRLRAALQQYETAPYRDTAYWLMALDMTIREAAVISNRQLALDAYARGTQLLNEFGAASAYITNLFHHNAAFTLRSLGELSAARKEGWLAYEAADNYWDRADALNVIALIEGEAGNRNLERELFNRAIGLMEGQEPDPDMSFKLHINLANSYLETDQPEKAEASLKIAQANLNPESAENTGFYWNMEGELQVAKGNTAAGLSAFNEALRALGNNEVEEEDGLLFLSLENSKYRPELIQEIYEKRAYALEERGELDLASRNYAAHLDLETYLQGQMFSAESRYGRSASLRPVIDAAIQLEYTRYLREPSVDQAWKIFALSERAKAYHLTRSYLENSEYSNREKELAIKIANIERRNLTTAKEAELAALRIELEQLVALRIRGARVTENTLSQDAIASLTRESEADLLAYHIVDSFGLLFHLNQKGELGLTELQLEMDLQGEIESWRNAIRASAYRGKSIRAQEEQASLDATVQKIGQKLTKQLLPGLKEKDLQLDDQLIIVPDGLLNYLPFASLPLPKVGDKGEKGPAYLVDEYSLQMIHSVRHFQLIKGVEPLEASQDLIAFAPQYTGKVAPDDDRLLRSVRALALKDTLIDFALAPLRYNTTEVNAIADLLQNSTVRTGLEARKDQFLKDMSSAKILHLSGHGLANPQQPEFSFLAFSQSGNKLQREELLFYNDLLAHSVASELVVLSACETSIGKIALGEAPLSLGTGFALAGARSTLTTLWQVDDEATQELMVRFYQELASGASRTEALASAQQYLRTDTDFSHPYYWSGFTLHGAGGPIDVARPWNWWLLGAITGFFGVFGLIWLKQET